MLPSTFPEPTREDDALRPFPVYIPDAILEDLRARLRRTRWPGALDPGWTLGAAPDELRALCAHWAGGFDWRRIEAELNALEHYVETIEGRRLHFVLARSAEPGALPLVLLHGWPGSFVEFRRLLGPLTDPAAHGGAPEDAFHVVCPSLPGYAFSEPPKDSRYDYRSAAGAIASLLGALGFARFAAHGGDAGAAVAAWLGADRPERMVGIHLSTVLVGRPPGGGDPMEGVTAEEAAALRVHREVFLAEQAAHLEIQGTRPQTLAYALEDSPAGLAAWFVDKIRMWSGTGDLAAFDRDDLLANLTLYWATGTVASSMRYYHAVRHGTGRLFPDRRVEVPTGCAIFPREVYRPPRRWAEAWFDLRRWTPMPRGGHFPAWEAPEPLVDDLRAFFRPLRRGTNP